MRNNLSIPPKRRIISPQDRRVMLNVNSSKNSLNRSKLEDKIPLFFLSRFGADITEETKKVFYQQTLIFLFLFCNRIFNFL